MTQQENSNHVHFAAGTAEAAILGAAVAHITEGAREEAAGNHARALELFAEAEELIAAL